MRTMPRSFVLQGSIEIISRITRAVTQRN